MNLCPGDAVIIEHPFMRDEYVLAQVTKVTPAQISCCYYVIRHVAWNDEVVRRSKHHILKILGGVGTKPDAYWTDIACQLKQYGEARDAAISVARKSFMEQVRAVG